MTNQTNATAMTAANLATGNHEHGNVSKDTYSGVYVKIKPIETEMGVRFLAEITSGYRAGKLICHAMTDNPVHWLNIEDAEHWLIETGYTVDSDRGNGQKYSDGEVVGVDSDGHLVQWNSDAGATYNSGETLEQFGVQNLSEQELLRAQGKVSKAGVSNASTLEMAKKQDLQMNIRPDMVFVIGIQDTVTKLAEKLCAEVGLRVHYAMKKSDPSKRIESINDEAVIVPLLPNSETLFCCGLRASELLLDTEGGPLDCNWANNDGSAFAIPLLSFLFAHANANLPVPNGWFLADKQNEPLYPNSNIGYCGPTGTVTADFGGSGPQLWQIPQTYSKVFPLIEKKHW